MLKTITIIIGQDRLCGTIVIVILLLTFYPGPAAKAKAKAIEI
jgi:hypothetical protein